MQSTRASLKSRRSAQSPEDTEEPVQKDLKLSTGNDISHHHSNSRELFALMFARAALSYAAAKDSASAESAASSPAKAMWSCLPIGSWTVHDIAQWCSRRLPYSKYTEFLFMERMTSVEKLKCFVSSNSISPSDIGLSSRLQVSRLREEVNFVLNKDKHVNTFHHYCSSRGIFAESWVNHVWLPHYVGLKQYSELFHFHQINILSLLSLTQKDLEVDLGIRDSQHVEILLSSIHALKKMNFDLTPFEESSVIKVQFLTTKTLCELLLKERFLDPSKVSLLEYCGVNGAYLCRLKPGKEDFVMDLFQSRLGSNTLNRIPLLRLFLYTLLSDARSEACEMSVKKGSFVRRSVSLLSPAIYHKFTSQKKKHLIFN